MSAWLSLSWTILSLQCDCVGAPLSQTSKLSKGGEDFSNLRHQESLISLRYLLAAIAVAPAVCDQSLPYQWCYREANINIFITKARHPKQTNKDESRKKGKVNKVSLDLFVFADCRLRLGVGKFSLRSFLSLWEASGLVHESQPTLIDPSRAAQLSNISCCSQRNCIWW